MVSFPPGTLEYLEQETRGSINSVFSVRTGPLRSYMDLGEWPQEISVLCAYSGQLWCTDEVKGAPLSENPWWLGSTAASLALEELDSSWHQTRPEEVKVASAIFVGPESGGERQMLLAGASADTPLAYCESASIREGSMFGDPGLGSLAGAFGVETALAVQTLSISDKGEPLGEQDESLVKVAAEGFDSPNSSNGFAFIDRQGETHLIATGLGRQDMFGRIRPELTEGEAERAVLYLLGFNQEPSRVLVANPDGAFAVIDGQAYPVENPIADLFLAGIGYRSASLIPRLCEAALRAAAGIIALAKREAEDTTVVVDEKHKGLGKEKELALNIAYSYAEMGELYGLREVGESEPASAEQVKEQIASQVKSS